MVFRPRRSGLYSLNDGMARFAEVEMLAVLPTVVDTY